jgi:hypothetical protein
MKSIFKSYRGNEQVEKLFLDDQIELLIQNDTNKEMLFLKLKQLLMDRLYNDYEKEEEEEYLCYLCKNDSITPLCGSCQIKEEWVHNRIKKDTDTMKDYAEYKVKLSKDLSNYLIHYYPNFIENKKLADDSQAIKRKKGTKIAVNFYNKRFSSSLTPKFLYEIKTPEKTIADKHTVVDIITSKSKPKVLFGDEYLKFMKKYKVIFWILKISIFLFFIILFFVMIYFTR